jgi:ferredoxin
MKHKDEEGRQYSSHTRWIVELDAGKCSLCEVCARRCPTGAIILERKKDTFVLYFKHGACNGCGGEKTCEAICPEEAITVRELEKSAGRRGKVLLVKSELLRCSYCDEYYSPDIKLEKLGKKGLHHEVERSLCPICRRLKLVVKHIDEKQVPGGHAEYRSARDILRKTRRRFDKHEENDS